MGQFEYGASYLFSTPHCARGKRSLERPAKERRTAPGKGFYLSAGRGLSIVTYHHTSTMGEGCVWLVNARAPFEFLWWKPMQWQPPMPPPLLPPPVCFCIGYLSHMYRQTTRQEWRLQKHVAKPSTHRSSRFMPDFVPSAVTASPPLINGYIIGGTASVHGRRQRQRARS